MRSAGGGGCAGIAVAASRRRRSGRTASTRAGRRSAWRATRALVRVEPRRAARSRRTRRPRAMRAANDRVELGAERTGAAPSSSAQPQPDARRLAAGDLERVVRGRLRPASRRVDRVARARGRRSRGTRPSRTASRSATPKSRSAFVSFSVNRSVGRPAGPRRRRSGSGRASRCVGDDARRRRPAISGLAQSRLVPPPQDQVLRNQSVGSRWSGAASGPRFVDRDRGSGCRRARPSRTRRRRRSSGRRRRRRCRASSNSGSSLAAARGSRRRAARTGTRACGYL